MVAGRLVRRLTAGAAALAMVLGCSSWTPAAAADSSAPSLPAVSTTVSTVAASATVSVPAKSAPLPAGSFTALPSATVFSGSIAAHATARVSVTGVPAGATAVLSLTETAPALSGHLTAYTSATTMPAVPNLSFAAGQSATNQVVVQTAAAGTVDIHSDSAGAAVVRVDVAGYYLAGTPTAVGMFGAAAPTTVMQNVSIAAGKTAAVKVAGVGAIPAAAAIVTMNLAVSGNPGAGFLTAYPTGSANPGTQNLVFTANRPQTQLSTVRVGTGGTITVVNNSTVAEVITADVLGYFTTGNPTVVGGFQKVAPATLLNKSVAANTAVNVQITGVATVAASGVGDALVQVSTTTATQTGAIIGYTAGAARPTQPSLFIAPARNSAALVLVPVSATGAISFYNSSSGTVTLRVDIVGYYLSASKFSWAAPTWVNNEPTTISSTSCVDPTFCMVGDHLGRIELSDGTTWRTTYVSPVFYQTGGEASIDSISCVTRTFCMASQSEVEGDGDSVPDLHFLRWDGTTWSVTFSSGSWTQYQVSCVSTTFCMGTRGDGGWEVFNGTTWSQEQSGSAGILACGSVTFCVASDGVQTQRFNGATWAADPSAPANLTSLSCPSAAFCLGIASSGSTGNSYALVNGVWTAPKAAPSTGPVDCVSATFCMQTTNGRGARYNGTTWTTTPTTVGSAGPGSNSIDCSTVTFCASGNGQNLTRWNGTQWAASTLMPNAGLPLGHLDCASSLLCAAEDHYNVYTTTNSFQSKSSTTIGDDFDLDNNAARPSGVSCPSVMFCQATVTGEYSTLQQFNGASWSLKTDVSSYQIFPESVSCAGTAFCVVAGRTNQYWNASTPYLWDPNEGTVFISTPTGFSQATTAMPTIGLHHVSCASTTFCVAVGSSNQGSGAGPGTSTVFNGTSWSALTNMGTAAGGPAVSLSCGPLKFCVAVDGLGQVMTFNGSAWSAPTVVSGAGKLVAVACTNTAACFAISSTRKLLQYTTNGWSAGVQLPAAGTPTEMSCPTVDYCAIADDQGYVTTGRA